MERNAPSTSQQIRLTLQKSLPEAKLSDDALDQLVNDLQKIIGGDSGHEPMPQEAPLSFTHLQKEHQRLANIVEAANIGGWEWNVQTGEGVIDEQWALMLGYSLDELQPVTIETWTSLMHPEDLSVAETQFQEIFLQQRTQLHVECRMKHRNGHWVWVEDRGKLISMSDEGAPLMMYGIIMDISHRKILENQLSECDQLLNKLSQQVPGAIYQYQVKPDGTSCFPYASEGIHLVYEVSPDEVKNDDSKVYQRLHPEDHSRVAQSIMHSAKTLEVWQEEYRVNLPEKGVRWLQGNARPEPQPDGSVIWHGFIHDVTEKKEMENALERERNLFTAGPVITIEWRVDDLSVAYVSSNVSQVMGYTQEEMTDPSFQFTSIVHPDDMAVILEEIDHHIQNGVDEFEQSYRIRTKSGDYRWVYDFTKLDRNQNGEIIGGRGYIFDQTETKEAHLAREESEHKFQMLVENLNEGICQLNDAGYITYVNGQLAEMLGYSVEEMTGTHFSVFEFDDSCDLSTGSTARQRQLGGHTVDEAILTHKNGHPQHVQMSYAPLYNRQGHYVGAIAGVQDITEQKETQMKLQEYADRLEQKNKELEITAQKAEAATKAKSQFLANMSHEIRTPMNGILGFLQLLEETDLNQTQQKQVSYIKSSTDALLTLINDILDFSKIESGKMELESIPFDLRSTVEDVVMTQLSRAQSKNLELNLQFQPGLPHQVQSDPTRLRQIVTNLVSNAVKFTETGSVTVYCREVKREDTISTIEFRFMDTGVGISPEAQQQLFEVFNQGDISNTREYGGTGLGLAITRDLVHLMGGSIHVESTLGQESTFTVILPLPLGDTPYLELSEHEHLKGKHIVIVDDVQQNREMLRSYLEEAGCRVTESARGSDALDLLIKLHAQQDPVHAVVLDQQMPGMTGSDLASALQAIPTTKDLPLCLVTSTAVVGSAEEASRAGFHAYLPKPLRRRDFLDAVANLVTRENQPIENPSLITSHTLREAHGHLKTKVLVVEDHKINRDFVVQLLRSRGVNCDVALNGQEAVEACEKEQYDVLLMDVQMPVMDGLEATRQIRSRPIDPQPMIVAMTAHAMKDDEAKCLQAGMDSYLSKPLDKEKISKLFQENAVSARNDSGAISLGAKDFESYTFDDWLNDFTTGTGLEETPSRTLLTEGIASWEELLEEVRSELEQQNESAVEEIFHKIKGSAENLRMTSIAQLALQAEESIKNGEWDALWDVIEQMQHQINQVNPSGTKPPNRPS